MNNDIWKNDILNFLHMNFKIEFRKQRSNPNQLITSELKKATLIMEISNNKLIINFIKFDDKYQGKGLFSKFIKLCLEICRKNKLNSIVIENVMTKQMADVAEWLNFKHAETVPSDKYGFKNPLFEKSYGDYILNLRK